MILTYSTFVNDNDVDVFLTPQDATERALLRALSNRRIQLLRAGTAMTIRFKAGK